MGKQKQEKQPFQQQVKNCRQILALIWQMDRSYFPLVCVGQMVDAAVPYAALVLSAWVLHALTVRMPVRTVMMAALTATAGIFALQAVRSLLTNQLDVRRDVMYHNYHSMVEEKILSMDFQRIDSPQVKALKDRIQKDNNWGAGLYSVLWQFNDILAGVFRLVAALVIGISVVKESVRAEGGILPSAIALLCAIMAAAAVCVKGKAQFRKKEFEFMNHSLTEAEKEEELDFCWSFAGGDGYDYKNGKDIRICGGYGLMRQWTVDRLGVPAARKRILDAAKGAGGNGFCTGAVDALSEGGAFLIAAVLALAGTMGIGNMVCFAGCLKNLIAEPVQLAGFVSDFALSAKRQASTLDMLALEDEMYKGKLPVEKRSDSAYQIEFKDVSFRYPGTDAYALRHVSFRLEIGEKLAVVGRNGSGKTTMIKLLCRLYDPQEGEILLNGVDIRKFKQDEYLRLFSVVFQDYALFSLMLAQNIAADTGYDAARVRGCLKEAGFGGRLETLEEGIETYLYKDYTDRGVEISGGEAQKAALARAIYKDAPFILLDEPTAALDPLAEYEIYTNFDRMAGDKTAVYISHRLSSCRFCRKIAVFHEGRLVQMGSHEKLLEDVQGHYYKMWQAQAQYYQEEEI